METPGTHNVNPALYSTWNELQRQREKLNEDLVGWEADKEKKDKKAAKAGEEARQIGVRVESRQKEIALIDRQLEQMKGTEDLSFQSLEELRGEERGEAVAAP